MVQSHTLNQNIYSKIEISVPNMLGQRETRTSVGDAECSSCRVFNHATNPHVSKTGNKSSAQFLGKQMFHVAQRGTT